MKITRIRDKKNQKVIETLLQQLKTNLDNKLDKVGFITNVEVVNQTTMHIGLTGRSFMIDTQKLGYNAKENPNCINNYQRCNIPTWSQRVEFNNIVNKTLDKFKLKANVKSGIYTVREFEYGAFTEGQWHDQKYNNQNYTYNGDCRSEIYSEKEAKELFFNAHKVAQHKEDVKQKRIYKKKCQKFFKKTKIVVIPLWKGKTDVKVNKFLFNLYLRKFDDYSKRTLIQHTIKNTYRILGQD